MIVEFTAVYEKEHETGGFAESEHDLVCINSKYVVAIERDGDITTIVLPYRYYNVLLPYEDVILKLFSNRDA